jgi:small multidrug resistance pump
VWVSLQLAGAIAAEIVGTTALRASQGFTRLVPSLIVLAAYPLSFFLLSKVLERMSLAVAYAVWSAVGTAVIALIGAVAYGEPLTAAKIFFLAVVVVGVVGLQLSATGG